MMTDVVPSPVSSSCVLDNSIMLFAAGCVTSISLKIAFPSFVNTIPTTNATERGTRRRSITRQSFVIRHPSPFDRAYPALAGDGWMDARRDDAPTERDRRASADEKGARVTHLRMRPESSSTSISVLKSSARRRSPPWPPRCCSRARSTRSRAWRFDSPPSSGPA